MGKRELFIILGFVVVGVITFQIAAPPAAEGQGFSFSRLWNRARQDMMRDSASAEHRHEATIAVGPELTELRLTEVPRDLRVVGEDRQDIGYRLDVRSTGPDPASALEYAKRTRLSEDQLGSALTVQMSFPREGRQTAKLEVRVPRRLAIRVQGVSVVDVTSVAAVHLDPISGDSVITHIAGAVTGVHRSGSLRVDDVGSLKLTLQNSSARLSDIRNGVVLDLRQGTCTLRDSRGPLELDAANAEVTVAAHTGPIRIGGNGGRVTVDAPSADTRIDLRRAELEVVLRTAVNVTAMTTDETLRLLLVGPPPVAIDALATEGGSIQGKEFGLTPDEQPGRQRVTTTIGDRATSKVALRNLRGDVVIRKGK
jgi:hypothetical protein